MNRRSFFNKGAQVAVGAVVLQGIGLGKAQGEETEPQSEESKGLIADISRNHGHSLAMTTEEVVSFLRSFQSLDENGESTNEGFKTLSIQGQSGHPHTVRLSFDDALAILLGEQLMVESSIDFGHSHSATISLEV